MELSVLPIEEREEKNRTEFVTLRFTPTELAALQELASARGVTRAEMIRGEALGMLEKASLASKELVEIVGVRILLLTLLKPLLSGKQLTSDAVDKVNATAKQMKKELASAIAAGEQD